MASRLQISVPLPPGVRDPVLDLAACLELGIPCPLMTQPGSLPFSCRLFSLVRRVEPEPCTSLSVTCAGQRWVVWGGGLEQMHTGTACSAADPWRMAGWQDSLDWAGSWPCCSWPWEVRCACHTPSRHAVTRGRRAEAAERQGAGRAEPSDRPRRHNFQALRNLVTSLVAESEPGHVGPWASPTRPPEEGTIHRRQQARDQQG